MGFFIKKLSDYPNISEWEMQSILDFINYESKYGRSCRIEAEQSVLDAIERFKAEKRTGRVSVPEKITMNMQKNYNDINFIRPALSSDASRIAEIIITNYRVNFYPFFRNDRYYFGELNVVDMASEYCEGSDELKNTFVYDDGVVKGIIRIDGDEIAKLFVEPQFQNMGIGAVLFDFAVNEMKACWLWVLEYNTRGISFYKKHGFDLTGERIIEEGWVPLLKMKKVKD